MEIIKIDYIAQVSVHQKKLYIFFAYMINTLTDFFFFFFFPFRLNVSDLKVEDFSK